MAKFILVEDEDRFPDNPGRVYKLNKKWSERVYGTPVVNGGGETDKYGTSPDSVRGKTEGITLRDYGGTWYIIDAGFYNGKRVFLLESEEDGDDVPAVIVDKDGRVVMNGVWNGLDELLNNLPNLPAYRRR